MKSAKITFYAYEKKKSIRTKRIPIYMRVAKGKSKVEASLDLSITEDEFNKKLWNQSVQCLEDPNHDINIRLNEIRKEFKGLEYIYKNDFQNFTPDEIKKKILGLEAQNPMVLSALDYVNNHYEQAVLNNDSIVNGTKVNYRKSITHFTKYLDYKKEKKVTLSAFNSTLAHGFYDYLLKPIPELKKRGITKVSAASIIIKIKAIFARAVDTDLIKKNPFSKIRLQRTSPKKAELNIDEVRALYKLDFSKDKKLDVYRDLFLFQIYTGLAYSDLDSLRKDDLNWDDNGCLFENKRKKTSAPIMQYFVIQATDLIKKYESHWETDVDERLFPQRSLGNINDALKFIQLKANIKKNLSTHIGRHTACQLISELADIKDDVIKLIFGWKINIRDTGSLLNYRRNKVEMLLTAKNKFENFLNENLCKD